MKNITMKRTLYYENVIEYCRREGLMNLAGAKEWKHVKFSVGFNLDGRYHTCNITPDVLYELAEFILMYSTRETLDLLDIVYGLDNYTFNTFTLH